MREKVIGGQITVKKLVTSSVETQHTIREKVILMKEL